MPTPAHTHTSSHGEFLKGREKLTLGFLARHPLGSAATRGDAREGGGGGVRRARVGCGDTLEKAPERQTAHDMPRSSSSKKMTTTTTPARTVVPPCRRRPRSSGGCGSASAACPLRLPRFRPPSSPRWRATADFEDATPESWGWEHNAQLAACVCVEALARGRARAHATLLVVVDPPPPNVEAVQRHLGALYQVLDSTHGRRPCTHWACSATRSRRLSSQTLKWVHHP
jgi:hypothetical protein